MIGASRLTRRPRFRPVAWMTLAACFSIASSSSAALSQELGKLFFTPQQRQDLDRRRASNVPAAAVPTVTADERVTVNGQVTRSNGPGTTWINGQPREQRGRSGTDASQVAIPPGGGRPAISLKVGETLDSAKGETRDGLEGGMLSIKSRR